ncbi:MAG TPA: polysaccharide biosynthesis/export family protein, partial [Pyrinomonadaceae bacterium]|nr:polysaccharide biosynthesis/export family protein [Pyrinomonadaceae bacterium]
MVASAAILLSAATVSTIAQGNDARTKNNPYFPSPSTRAQKADSPRVPVVLAKQVSISAIARLDTDIQIRPASVQRTSTYSKNVEGHSSSPTGIYKIGIGDVIYVNLKNAPNSSGFVTVKDNGMIDFPIAGDKLVIAGRTAEEAAEMLAAGITIYSDPQVEIKVRDYRSHKIIVSGMVERSGESSIQREAVPLYVVCAQAGVDPKATKALVRRADLAKVETFDLHDPNTDKVLIYPGNAVEFTAGTNVAAPVTTGFYYIAGNVNLAGQKE